MNHQPRLLPVQAVHNRTTGGSVNASLLLSAGQMVEFPAPGFPAGSIL